MKTPRDYAKERKKLVETLKDMNNQACIQFATILRTWDTYKRLSIEASEKPDEGLIPVAYFEAVYKLLSFAPEGQKLTLMAGTAEQIEKLVSEVQTARGFYDEKGFWIEL